MWGGKYQTQQKMPRNQGDKQLSEKAANKQKFISWEKEGVDYGNNYLRRYNNFVQPTSHTQVCKTNATRHEGKDKCWPYNCSNLKIPAL